MPYPIWPVPPGAADFRAEAASFRLTCTRRAVVAASEGRRTPVRFGRVKLRRGRGAPIKCSVSAVPELNPSANGREATARAETEVELSLTLEEARVLSEVANRGMLSAADGGAPVGNPRHAKAALEKLDAGIEEADRVRSLRSELEQSGLATAHLGDMQVVALARRVAEMIDS